ncbi:MAG: tail fiber domain-containing protein [Chitinophagales bacterium]
MKKHIVLFVVAFGFAAVYSQTNIFPATGSAGIGTIAPNSSALLEMVSNSKGLLIARMTIAQRNAIVAPATGLLIYQTNSTPGFYYYNGSAWTAVAPVGANLNLSNLGATAINQNLVPAATNSRSLGTTALRWKDVNTYTIKFADATAQNTAAKIYMPGAGISITGVSISNTAPDQIITLAGTGASSVTGTYPNFTINSPVVGSGWLLSGNGGTIDGADFIGTTDSAPLNFRMNNQKAGRIENMYGLANTFFGYQAGNSISSGYYNSGFGMGALLSNTIGYYNAAFGLDALYSNNTGYQNSAFGLDALYQNTTGYNNTAIGFNTMYLNYSGHENTAIGNGALYLNNAGNYNVALGEGALGSNSTGDNNIAIGTFADVSSGSLSNATAIGYNAKVSASHCLVLGGIGSDTVNVGIGVTAPTATLHISGSIKIQNGTQAAGKVLTSDNNGLATWQTPTGGGGGWQLTGNVGTSDALNFIGTTDNVPLNFRVNNYRAGRIDQFQFNTFFGFQAGVTNTTGNSNTASGFQALLINSTGNYNTAIGMASLQNSTGSTNTGVGNYTLYSNTGNSNTAAGFSALLQNTSGNNNTASGTNALYSNTSGNNNLGIGFNADVLLGNLTNAAAIGYNAKVSTSNSIVLGGTGADAVNVGIGTTAPSAKLEVNGAVKITDGNQGTGKVLTSDAFGFASWQNPAGTGSWSLTGNSGTISGINFIGTSDDQPVSIKVNNQKAGRIESTSNGFGNSFFGYQGGNSNVFGSYNSVIGYQSFYSNYEGNNNSSFGKGALYSNVAGSNATVIGVNAMQYANNQVTAFTNYNIAVGFEALRGSVTASANTGNFNTTVGYQSLRSNTTGFNNTAMGFVTLYNNTTGNSNTAIGYSALSTNTEGYHNTAIGTAALSGNTLGASNTAIGSGSLSVNSIGVENTAVGQGTLASNSVGNYNTATGILALNANSIGNSNTATGSYSLLLNSIGNSNTANGSYALYQNTMGSNNTASGESALGSNTIGNYNTGYGFQTLHTNVAGSNATAIGYNAMRYANNQSGAYTNNSVALGFEALRGSANPNINTGNQNTAIGYQSLTSNTTGSFNTAAGFLALYSNTVGFENSATGSYALYTNISGGRNTAIGNYSLYSNTYGSTNTANGYHTLYSNTLGNQSTASGYYALNANTIGNSNTATGTYSMMYNTEGFGNTASGTYALYGNTIGGENTACGYQSLDANQTGSLNTGIGAHTLFNNISGSDNTVVGVYSGYSITGNSNTAVGVFANITGSNNNAIALGAGAFCDASNKARIGNASVSSIGGEVGWTTYSDSRIKENIQQNVPGLEFINQLNPVTYHLNIKKQNNIEGIPDSIEWDSKYDIEKIQFTGLIAQEVEAAAQNINYDFSGIDKSGKLMGLRYSEFVVPLVKAVQELDSITKQQNTLINKQQSEIDELKAIINATGLNDGLIKFGTSTDNAFSPMLGQNMPNPFDHSTLIPFRIPKDCKDASIMIINTSEGKVITIIPISCNETHISFEAGQIASGNYTYTLIVDGNIIGTKTMILAK